MISTPLISLWQAVFTKITGSYVNYHMPFLLTIFRNNVTFYDTVIPFYIF